MDKKKTVRQKNTRSLRSLRTLLMKKKLSYIDCCIILYNVEAVMYYYDETYFDHYQVYLTRKEQLVVYHSICMFFDKLTLRLENDSIMFKAFDNFVHSETFLEPNNVEGFFGNTREIFNKWIGDNIKRDGESRYPTLVKYLKKLKLKNIWE